MQTKSNKLLHFIALLCLAAVAIALVSQHVYGLQPCAWCVLQRLIYLAIAVMCWIGILSTRLPTLRRLAALLAALLSLGGIAAAWFQYSVASKMFSCDQTFADRFMVQTGLDGQLPWLFGIFATCMDAKVQVLGFEYAIWSLVLFAVLGLLSLSALIRRT